MNHKAVLKYLYGLDTPKFLLGLKQINNLLNRIGNPQKQLKCIHVAGTNGKGSVCAMAQSVLMQAGYKVGMYTSPHLKKFNERIRIDDRLISDREIAEYFMKVRPFVTKQTFFEITTAMAFLYFYEKKVDYAVLEVGLGGRLDATNVVVPLVSVITNIGLEHTQWLGNTVEKIAFEKAGIIKENTPIVTGAKGSALKTIKKISKGKNAPLFLSKKHGDVGFEYLDGAYQQQNKDIVFTVFDVLRKLDILNIDKNKVLKGIKGAKWPGRMQFVSRNVLIDGAHNADGFKALARELRIIKKQRKIKNFVFIIALQKTKDIKKILGTINPLISKIIFTKSPHAAAAEPKTLLRQFNKINKNLLIERKIILEPKKALKYAKKTIQNDDLIVVTGSLYMIGAVI